MPKSRKEYIGVMKKNEVSDETLEFISLDDEALYRADDEIPDEEYEDEDYSDEEYEDDYYADEDYDDEYYEDEDYDYDVEDDYDYEDEKYPSRNIFVRSGRHIANMSSLDRVLAIFGICILAAAIVTGSIYFGKRTASKQVAAFADIGGAMDGIEVIGESGLLAMADAESMRMVMVLEEEEVVEEATNQEGSIEVTLNLTSIQSDIKIKFANKSTGKLIRGVPFEVEVSGKSGKKYEMKDEDKDGIIYQNKVDAGTYTVKALPLEGDEWKEYLLPAAASTIEVTDTIAYKKIDVSDEIKKESEINAAAEDTAIQDTQVESQLTDTVEWVESTKTPGDSADGYDEIGKDQIPDPSTISALPVEFVKTVNDGIESFTAEAEGSQAEGSQAEGSQAEEPQTEGPQTEIGSSCSCDPKCTSDEDAQKSECSMCKEGKWKECCQGGNSGSETTKPGGETENPPVKCTCENKCTTEKTDQSCEICKSNPSQCTGKEQATITINCPAALTVGSKGQAAATVSTGGTVTWSSSDSGIVTIDADGNMEAKAVGSVTITAKSGSVTATATVTVEAVQYSSITLSGTDTVKVNDTAAVSGKTTPEGGTISWTSSNEQIVKIESSNGTTASFKGIAAGTATITAECGTASAVWQVTVTKDLAADDQTKLIDKDGNQVYVIKDGEYVEAVYADYYTADKFYLRKEKYFYTGWQTIDGSTYFFDRNGSYVTGEQVIQGARYTFGSDGKLSAGSGTMGIDVSKWNGSIDWNAVRNSGVSYVIIRCGYRGSSTGVLVEDPKFASNIKGAKAAGLRVGVYFFSQAVNEVEAVEEASMALKLIGGYGLDFPIFLDVEASGGRGDGISASTRTAVCKAFCETVRDSGYSAGIYANKTWLTSYINTGSLTSYKIWLAQYAASPSYTATRYDMWQYSSKGSVSGISGNVDMNISYM